MSVESSEKKRNLILGAVCGVIVLFAGYWYFTSSSDSSGDPKVKAANERLNQTQAAATEEVKKAAEAPPPVQKFPGRGSVKSK